jgi:hypothetical protein
MLKCPNCGKPYKEGELKWETKEKTTLLYPCGHIASNQIKEKFNERKVWASHELTLEMFKKMTGEL